MNAIPNNVTRFVQAHLQSLQELRQQFDSVFALELGGSKGRYIWERTQEAIQRRLRDAQEGLNLFRSSPKKRRRQTCSALPMFEMRLASLQNVNSYALLSEKHR